MEIERRAFKIELRDAGDGARVMTGTPIVYGKRSEDMGFFEFVAAGAAKAAINSSDARALYGHNSDTLLPLGRQSADTLRLKDEKHGVDIEIDPPKRNSFVDALIESIERGDVREMSFGFTVEDDSWEGLDTEKPTRTITKIGEIIDVSYVAFAAYNDTSVGLRCRGNNVEEALRSLKEARKIAGRGGDDKGERARSVEIFKLKTQLYV